MSSTILSKNKTIALIAILHIVGLIGILSPYQEIFITMSSLNLFISSILIFPKKPQKFFLRNSIVVVLLGFIIEFVGITTGEIFGSYLYGTGLAPLLLGVPIIIGINWWMLCYGSLELARRYATNKSIQVLCATVLVVSIDFLMEHVAPKLNYWTWANKEVPFQNFIAWFVIGFIFIKILENKNRKSEANEPAQFLVIAQIAFFLILHLSL